MPQLDASPRKPSLAKTMEATLITADKELYDRLSSERKALSQLLEQYE